MRDERLIELFERYRSHGDVEALAKLFDELAPVLLRVARHLDSRRSEAEDLVQTTFLVAIERSSTYDAARPLVPWLMGILINQSRLARRRRKEVVDGGEHETETSSTQQSDLESSELAAAVTRALAELPETYRAVLVAHLQEGKKPRDIAKELGRPQGTVRAQLHRGLRLMRDLLPASFALGFLALLAPRSLAGVRRNVLMEAARRARPVGAGPGAAQPTGSALSAQSAVVGMIVIALGLLAWSWTAGDAATADGARVAGRGDAIPAPEPGASPRDADLAPGARVRVLPLEPAASPTRGELAPYGSVLVHVARTGSRDPAAGTLISVVPWGEERWFDLIREMRTAADGSATFARVHAGFVGIHGERGEQTRVEVLPGRTTEVDLTLHAALEVRGRVLDVDGSPVGGAEITEYFGDGTPSPRPPAISSSDGVFTLRDVDTGHALGARASGRAPSRLVRVATPTTSEETRRAPVLYVQRSSRRAAGTVRDEADGGPIAGAMVRLGTPRTGGVSWRADGAAEMDSPALETRSAADGSFAFDSLPAGELELAVEAPDRPVFRAQVAARSGGDLDVRLARGARLAGVLRLADGAPAVGAEVRVVARAATTMSADSRTADGAGASTGSDATGRYSLVLAPGPHAIEARLGRFAPSQHVELSFVDGETRTWDAVLGPASVIRGRALTSDGQPLTRSLVRARAEDPELRPDPGAWPLLGGELDDIVQSWSDPDGNFVVPCLSDAPQTIEVRRRSYWLGPPAGRVEHILPGSRGVDVRAGARSSFFDGRIVDSDGRPVAAGIVCAWASEATGLLLQDIDRASGAFRIGPLLPGEYRLRVCLPDRAPIEIGSFRANVNAAHELGLLRLPAPGSVEIEGPGPFVLRGEDGLLRSLVAGPRADEWSTDGVPPGRYRVFTGVRDTGAVVEVTSGGRAGVRVD